MVRMILFLCFLCAAIVPSWGADESWTAQIETTDYDKGALKGQKNSLIDWKSDPNIFLDFRTWKAEREFKDLTPGWKIRQRISSKTEKMGSVLSCIGNCKIYRSSLPHSAKWQSQIFEGDEISTEKNSYLWLVLIDGTLVRLSPETTVGLLEINLQKSKVFVQARLNHGQIYWLPRSENKQKISDLPETDALFLPLMEREANLSWYARKSYKNLNELQKIQVTATSRLLGFNEQQVKLNEMIEENNLFKKNIEHELMLVAPNGTITVKNRALTWFYGFSRRSFFKIYSRSAEEENPSVDAQADFYYRGYVNYSSLKILLDQWMLVSEDGKRVGDINRVDPLLLASEIPFRRPTTLLLAREIFLKKNKQLWEDIGNETRMGFVWGYFLWSDELEKRKEFLLNHSRRIETTNLRSLKALTEVLEKNGDIVLSEFDERYFSRALEAYYKSIKTRRSFAKESVRDMSDLHYYGWVLKNARQ